MTTQFFKTVNEAIKYWYIPLIVGLLFISVGIWVLSTPIQSYLGLSLLFSLSFLMSGVIEIIFAISNRKKLDNWGWTLAIGILNVLVGILLFVTPSISITTLPYYVGFVVLFRSLSAISMSIELKNYGILEWGNLLAIGIVGTVLAFVLLWNPLFAGLSLVVWTALAFITLGGIGIYLSVKLKKIHDIPTQISSDLKNEFIKIQKDIQTEIAGLKSKVEA